jgi:hypothetical protein
MPGSPLASHCTDDTSLLKGKLEPSDEIVSGIQYSFYKSPVARREPMADQR